MDLVWLLIPAAVGLFALRTLLIARRLKAAAKSPALADRRALRDAKESLRAHRDHLDAAVASPREHLAAARGLSRQPRARARTPATGVDAMVEDFLPDRRL